MNLQNIPSKNKDIRKSFIADNRERVVTTEDNRFILDRFEEVETVDGWKCLSDVHSGDKLVFGDSNLIVKSVTLGFPSFIDVYD